MKQSGGRTDVIRACNTAPRGVALAIRFMQRNLDRTLTTAEIAVPAGTSERSLRRQFQRFTGQSPIAFHRHLRLEAARHTLRDIDAKADITTAAGMHGFSHLSHFTGQYRRRYGELPSATLRALRESSLPLRSHAICEPVSLIVLPFICTDSDSGNITFAETMTDQVISAMTRTRWLNVLSPNSDLPAANTIRVAPPCARYAVRGRVQWIGGRVQAVIRLIDLATGRQIWGNAFEGAAECAMELQQQVVEGVASALPALRDMEATRGKPRPEHDPVAVRCATQAFHAILEMTQSANGRALEHLDRSQSIDPEFPFAKALAAWCHAQRAACCFGDTGEVDRDKARRLTTLTLTLDNEDPLVLAILGHASTIFADLDLGSLLIEKCLAIDPGCPMAWQRRGWLGVYRGGDGALADFDRALALNPRGPERFNTFLGISQAHFMAGNYEAAANWAAQGLQERLPHETWAHRIAAVAQVRCGQVTAGRQGVALLRRQYPDITVGTIVNALPTMPAELLARQAEALESAGLPV